VSSEQWAVNSVQWTVKRRGREAVGSSTGVFPTLPQRTRKDGAPPLVYSHQTDYKPRFHSIERRPYGTPDKFPVSPTPR
jgi:hypothetical protein